MKILAVGDSFVPSRLFELGLAELASEHQIRYLELDMGASFLPSTPSERSLREFAGDPGQLVEALTDEDVLLVHGAPVSDAVLDVSPRLRIVGVARGGPVNVDIQAASSRGIRVIAAPGRNAEAVADLALAFMIMLARPILSGVRFVAGGGRTGESAFEGKEFFGHELGGQTLGLVGLGNVGSRVARRALAFGMMVLAFDPYVNPSQVNPSQIDGLAVQMTTLDDLLARSDFVSLHARVTPETQGFFDAARFRAMKPGACFVNSARETLVDEQALYDALVSGHVAGAALDVLRPRPDGTTNPLASLPNVIVTPHIGGATHEAALRGVQILASQLAADQAGQPMPYLVNPLAIGRPEVGRSR